MHCYFFIFATFAGSVAAFDGRLTLFADKLDDFRSKTEASYVRRRTSLDIEITKETTTTTVT